MDDTIPKAVQQGRWTPPAPFDFELSCRWRCAFSPGTDEWRGREYRRAVWLNGQPGRLAVKSRGVIDRPELEWRWYGAPTEAGAVEALVAHLFSADIDLAAFLAAAARDPVLRRAAATVHGFRLVRAPSLWEAVLAAALAQGLGAAANATWTRRLVATLGSDGALPPAAAVAGDGGGRLRQLGLPARQAGAILAAARELRTTGARRADAAEGEAALAPLLAIPGIGPATAAHALGYGLGHPDVLPASDSRLQRAAAELYQRRLGISTAGMQRLWSGLRGWRGYAALYTLAATMKAADS